MMKIEDVEHIEELNGIQKGFNEKLVYFYTLIYTLSFYIRVHH